MSWEKDKNKKLAEHLWTEINRAILKSPDVQFSIKKLEKLQLLDYVSEFNLVLEVDKLIESILKQKSEKEAKTSSILEELHITTEYVNDVAENESPRFSSSSSQWVDGKTLSENEILFEEYSNQHFDEKHWMKKAKIRFDNASSGEKDLD
jgi:hypothetical protein